MQIDERSPLDSALAAVHPRRVILAALALGGAAAAIAPAADLAAKKKKKKTWRYRAQFGSDGTGDANFSNPSGVAVSGDGLAAWVADTFNHRIVVWTRPDLTSTTWSYSTKFGTEGSGESNLLFPTGVTASADGLAVWVADTNNHRIVVWTRPDVGSTQWSFSNQFGSGPGSGDADLYSPTGVAISADKLTAWVASMANNRVSIWARQDLSSNWSHSANFGTQGDGDTNFSNPAGVSVSTDGLAAWVADQNNNRIVSWTRSNDNATDWSYRTQFGTYGTGNANIYGPVGVAVSADGRTAWVADKGNSRISVWTRPSSTSTQWKHSTNLGTLGSGNNNFSQPSGVAVSTDGRTAFVADTLNNRISIWTYS